MSANIENLTNIQSHNTSNAHDKPKITFNMESQENFTLNLKKKGN